MEGSKNQPHTPMSEIEGKQNQQHTPLSGTKMGGGCSSVRTVSDRHAAEVDSIPRCGKGFFYQSTFSALSYGVRTPMCAIACVDICAHAKDPVVHVRVRRITETLKHPACTVGWVARLSRNWLSPEKAARMSHGRNLNGTTLL